MCFLDKILFSFWKWTDWQLREGGYLLLLMKIFRNGVRRQMHNSEHNKTTELYSLNGWIVWCMNDILIKLLKKKRWMGECDYYSEFHFLTWIGRVKTTGKHATGMPSPRHVQSSFTLGWQSFQEHWISFTAPARRVSPTMTASKEVSVDQVHCSN